MFLTMEINNNILFDYDLTGKLINPVFTHIVFKNPIKYQINTVYNIYLKDIYLGKARLVNIEEVLFKNFTNHHSYINSGLPVDKFKQLLNYFFSNNNINDNSVFYFMTFVKILV